MTPFTQGLQITLSVVAIFEQRLDVVYFIRFIQQSPARGTPPFLVCRHTLLDQRCDVGAPRWKSRCPGYDWGRRRLFIGLEQVLAMLQDTERRMRAPFTHGQDDK